MSLGTSSFGIPEQYYSDPGTTLKIAVRESRFTDGPPLVGAVVRTEPLPDLALPSGDPSTLSRRVHGGAPMPTSDVQPFVFSVPNTGDRIPLQHGPALRQQPRRRIFDQTERTARRTRTRSTSFHRRSAAKQRDGQRADRAQRRERRYLVDYALRISPNFTRTDHEQRTRLAGQQPVRAQPRISPGRHRRVLHPAQHPLPPLHGGNATRQPPPAAPVYTVYEAQYRQARPARAAPARSRRSRPALHLHRPYLRRPRRGDARTRQLTATAPAHRACRRHVASPRAGTLPRRVHHRRSDSRCDTRAQPKDAAAIPQELPVSSSLVDVQSPSPVLRYIANSTSSFGATGTNALFSNTTANALDVAYSGSLQDGTTDIYTSRYYLAAAKRHHASDPHPHRRPPAGRLDHGESVHDHHPDPHPLRHRHRALLRPRSRLGRQHQRDLNRLHLIDSNHAPNYPRRHDDRGH